VTAPKAEDRDPRAVCTAQGTRRPCRAYRLPGSLFCRLHGEGGREQAQAQGKAGAVVAQALREAETSKLHLDTAEDVQRLLEATAGKLAAGQISPPAAAAMNAIARSALQAIDLRVTEEATREIARANASKLTGVRRR
jgi:hypothetical protein